jgi:hypothetical protein
VSMKEYEEMKIKVGDKVVINIQRFETNDTWIVHSLITSSYLTVLKLYSLLI